MVRADLVRFGEGYVMDPISLGVAGALLVAQAAESKAAGAVVDKVSEALGRTVDRVRAWFAYQGDSEGTAMLDAVLGEPTNSENVDRLGQRLVWHTENDPGFRSTLEALLAEAKAEGVNIGSVTQTARGDANVQIADVTGSNVQVSTGLIPPPRID